MRVHRQAGSHSVLRAFTATYLAVLLCLFAVNVVVGLGASQAVERELERANTALFSQLCQTLDAAFQPALNLAAQIGLDPDLRRLMYETQPLSSEHYYKVSRLVEQLRARKTVAPHIDFLYVYLHASDKVVSSTTHASPELFYPAALRHRELTYVQWLGLLHRSHARYFLGLTTSDESGIERPTVALLQSLPMENQAATAATFVVGIDAGFIRDLTRNLPWIEGGQILVVQKDDSVVFSTKPVAAGTFGFRDLTPGSPQRRDSAGADPVMVFSADSVATELRYVAVIPLQAFWGRLHYVRRLMLAATLAYGLGGAVFLVLYPRRHFRPLTELLRIVNPSGDHELGRGENEYRYIANMIRAIQQEKETVERRLEGQALLFREELLGRLLRGETSWHDIVSTSDGKSVAALFSADQPYVLLIFSISAPPELKRTELDARWPSILTSIVVSVVRNEGDDTSRCYVVHMADRIVAVVPAHAPVADLIARAQQSLRTDHGMDCVIAASAVHAQPADLASAYLEAQRAEQQRFLREGQTIFFYAPAGTDAEGTYYYPAEAESALANLVRLGDVAGASRLVDSILDVNFVSASLTLEKARCLVSDLAGTLVKIVDSLGVPVDGGRLNESSFLVRLGATRTLTEARIALHGFLEQACGRRAEHRHGVPLSERVKEHVRKKHGDINMNVSSIAYELAMTPGYVSRVFREETGMRLLDYISRARVDEARRIILTDSRATLASVARKTGFSGSTALIRAFRKYEGITPGQLKKSATASAS